MNKELLTRLNSKYAEEGMDLMQALRVWKESKLTPAKIRDQVRSDIRKDITSSDAVELYHLGSSMESDYNSICKPFEVNKGREDLIPENIKEKKIKLSPSIRQSMDRVGQNLYRDKTAKTYWTLKEKIADNGDKAIYLVAVEEPDEIKRKANIHTAATGEALQNLGGAIKQDVGQGVDAAGNAIQGAGQSVYDAAGNAVNAVGNTLGNAASAVGQGLSNAAQGVANFFSGGQQTPDEEFKQAAGDLFNDPQLQQAYTEAQQSYRQTLSDMLTQAQQGQQQYAEQPAQAPVAAPQQAAQQPLPAENALQGLTPEQYAEYAAKYPNLAKVTPPPQQAVAAVDNNDMHHTSAGPIKDYGRIHREKSAGWEKIIPILLQVFSHLPELISGIGKTVKTVRELKEELKNKGEIEEAEAVTEAATAAGISDDAPIEEFEEKIKKYTEGGPKI